jgi:hypothetical protein
MPDTCWTDGLHHNNRVDSPVAVSLLFKTTPPCQSSFALELNIMAPARCLKKFPEGVTFEFVPATMPCSVLGPSPAISVSEDVSLYDESLHPTSTNAVPRDTGVGVAAACAIRSSGYTTLHFRLVFILAGIFTRPNSKAAMATI